MLLRSLKLSRRGVHAVEAAVIYPVSFMLIIGLIVCATGIFRYQETCHFARAGARWAAVHGGQWASETNRPLTLPADVYNSAIQPYTVSLDPTQIGYAVSWSDPSQNPIYVDKTTGNSKINQVTVTVTYSWIPEAYVGGISFSATSTMPVEY